MSREPAPKTAAPRSGAPKQHTVFGGVAILAVGIAVVKVIGALFKIPLFNILGSSGSADFYNAYSIYSVLLTISTAGLPVALSKTVSEAHTLGRYHQEQKVFRVSLSAFLLMGVLSFLVMWFGSDWLAGLLHNSRAALGIKALAPAVVCVGCLSAFRGYAQGHMDMTPTSVSQIIEALCKLLLGLALAVFIMNQTLSGEQAEMQTSLAAAGAITGVTVGTILALIYMIWNYLYTKTKQDLHSTDHPDSGREILINLLRIAIPITLSTAMVPIINVLDNSLVQGQLQKVLLENPDSWRGYQDLLDLAALRDAMTAWSGNLGSGVAATMATLTQQVDLAQAAQQAGTALSALEQSALDLYDQLETASRALDGNYTAAMSLHNLPGSFMTALTAALIPAIASRLARRDRQGSAKITGSILRITALAAMPMGVGLSVLSEPIIKLLYPSYDVATTGLLLGILGPAAIFVCLVLVTNSILQAYGFVNLPIVTIFLGGVVKLVANYNLVALPSVNIYGAPVGTLLCYAVALVLNLIVLRRAVHSCPGYASVFAKPLLASLVMGGAAWASYGLLSRAAGLIPFLVEEGALNRMGNAVATLGAIGIAAVIYLILVLALRIISRDDVMLMPKGEKIAKILHL